jgi:sulfhydrogenase subunit alpha
MSNTSVRVEHLTRVEGHGNILFNARDGRIEKVQWQVSEAPRLFESFVRGRHYSEMSHLVSRICGICSIGHVLASLKATESAMNIDVSEQTIMLRRMALHGENMQSHILHIGYLVAPDLFRVGSVFPLLKTHPDAVRAIVKLHRLANEMSDLVCGRTTHPITLAVGGFTMVPKEKNLLELRKTLIDILPVCDAVATVILNAIHMLPDFKRETEYIGLVSDEGYALYDGMIGSTDTGRYPVVEYESVVNEVVVPQSTAKYCKHARESYMVGALARFNLNEGHLMLRAKQWAQRFGLNPLITNPFMNTIAQMVEYFHSVEESISLIDALLEKGLAREDATHFKVKASRGVGAVEVPRGILFHDYTYDNEGKCVKANCVIPTNQNHNNIQHDMEAIAPQLLGKPEREIELTLEMLVRAYDPCISCSTHYLTVGFMK